MLEFGIEHRLLEVDESLRVVALSSITLDFAVLGARGFERGAQPRDVQITVTIGVDTRALAECLPAALSFAELSFEFCRAVLALAGIRERALDADE